MKINGDAKRIRKLITQLNTMAEQRKALLDHLWVIENHTETLRIELMQLLKEENNHGSTHTG